jgi:hypothetical protein
MWWPWKKRVDPIPDFKHIVIPVVRNQGKAMRLYEMFDGPSLATPVEGIFK